jgi:hypothetical protein
MAKTRRRRIIAPGPRVCHPRLKHTDGECLTPDLVKKLGKIMGAPSELDGRHLRHWMTRRTRCKTERCWIEKSSMSPDEKTRLMKQYFRPSMPDSWNEDPDEWLDSLNLIGVMKQYEEVYPTFKFFGANPIDFSAPNPYKKDALEKRECLEDSICKLRLNTLTKEGKTHLGFIYNLDPSDKGGSHWIASFTDIPGHKSYYFDSYGFKPPPQIARFLRSLTLQDPTMKLQYNARRFQYGDTECGIYCLYFLIRMLEGDDFRKFCRRAPRDSDMLELRRWLFAPNN